METIILGIVGLIFLAGLAGGVRSLMHALSLRRSHRRGTDHIPIAFRFEQPEPVLSLPRERGRSPSLHTENAVSTPSTVRRGKSSALKVDEPAERTADPDPPVVLGFDPADPLAVELVEGRTIVFHRAAPGTMRLLPGRLEVEEGEDSPAEIRFVDVPGSPPEVTFGRRHGQPFRHVQLRSLTVSREHAKMAREGKDWVIANLSQTNPIIVNGVTLTAQEQRRVLNDGDRIEMGEVVFRYHGT